jgi:hypothetical protein
MHQHPDPEDDHQELDGEDLDDDFGRLFYQGDGLTVRALDAEQLQRFLAANQDRPARLLGSGWDASVDARPSHRARVGDVADVPQVAPWGSLDPAGPAAALPVEPVAGSLGRPGRSAQLEYRRQRTEELAGWARSLAWRAPLVAAAGLVTYVLAAQAGLPRAGLAGLVIAVLAGWRLRFRPSEQARTWQRGAHGERRTARQLRRLHHDGFVVFHDLAVPGSPANVDHLVMGPTGVFVIDSKQWTGQVRQSLDGLAWHNHYRLDRTLETVRWEAEAIGRLLGTRTAALLCVHGAQVDGGGLDTHGVAIVPASRLRQALGQDRVLSDADVQLLAATARQRLWPAWTRPSA